MSLGATLASLARRWESASQALRPANERRQHRTFEGEQNFYQSVIDTLTLKTFYSYFMFMKYLKSRQT